MAHIESLHSGTPIQRGPNPHEQRREYHFRSIIQSRLLDAIRDSLDEHDFSEADIREFAHVLSDLPQEAQENVLALPFELRGKIFAKYHEQLSSGKMTVKEIVQDLLEKNRRYGYGLGYHLSTFKVLKKKTATGENWDIKGTELDDRDDRPMAYYSEDYLNRYQKKHGSYLYVVRSENREEGSHKKDQKNHWGRAPFLSVIAEFDMKDIEAAIDSAIQKENAAPEHGAAIGVTD